VAKPKRTVVYYRHMTSSPQPLPSKKEPEVNANAIQRQVN